MEMQVEVGGVEVVIGVCKNYNSTQNYYYL